MKRLFYLMLSLALLAGCSKDKGIEEPDEPDVPVAPEEVTLELSAADLVFESDGGKQTFTITCNTAWTLSNESDWCMTDVTSGTGDKVVTVMVSASVETEDRNLHLSVSAGEKTSLLTVTEKHGDALVLAKDKFDLPTDGGDVSIEVKSDVEEVVIPAEYRSWISLAPETRAAEIKCYVFIILETKGKDGRRGYIVFRSGERSDTVFIFQAPEERLILSEDTCHVSGKGGDLTVELKTNIAYDVTIPSSAASWVSRVTEHSFRSDRLKLHVEADSIADRNAEIVIRNRYGDESDTLYICQTSLQSPKEEVTAAFDPDFAGLLQRRGYIPDSTRILIGDVRDIDTLRVGGTYAGGQAGKGLTSLAGIEYFESLTTLYCSSNQLTSLDVSKNTALTHLDCYYNQLTSLDVSKNTKLSVLLCNNNQLTSLDVSKNTALTYLRCTNNQLASLDVSNNTVLTDLFCYYNQLTSLDVSKNTALHDLDCQFNQLTSLDVSKNTALTILGCHSNQLTSLDISNNMALTLIACYDNPGDGKSVFPVTAWFNDNNIPTDLKLLKGKSWTYGENTITIKFQTEEDLKDITADFDPAFAKVLQEKGYISDASYIRALEVKFREKLDLAGGTEDSYFQTGERGSLTSLKGIEYFESLTSLDCSYNQLTSLDVSKNKALESLTCGRNPLTTLDVSNNTDLTFLDCYGAQLEYLDISNNSKLSFLHCTYNQLSSLDVSKNTKLSILWCGGNKLASLDISQNYILTDLNVSQNYILTDLDVSQNVRLEQLSCFSNQLTSLDVSNNIALKVLECACNKLTSIDVSKNIKLQWLWCYSNKLTSLDISKNTELRTLSCNNNPGDGIQYFPVTAWFDNDHIPDDFRTLNSGTASDIRLDGMSWWGTISIDFRKAE